MSDNENVDPPTNAAVHAVAENHEEVANHELSAEENVNEEKIKLTIEIGFESSIIPYKQYSVLASSYNGIEQMMTPEIVFQSINLVRKVKKTGKVIDIEPMEKWGVEDGDVIVVSNGPISPTLALEHLKFFHQQLANYTSPTTESSSLAWIQEPSIETFLDKYGAYQTRVDENENKESKNPIIPIPIPQPAPINLNKKQQLKNNSNNSGNHPNTQSSAPNNNTNKTSEGGKKKKKKKKNAHATNVSNSNSANQGSSESISANTAEVIHWHDVNELMKVSLNDVHPKVDHTHVSGRFPLEILQWSHWNPLPKTQFLNNEWFYLIAKGWDGEELSITAHKEGFTRNKSTRTEFDPTFVGPTYHNLPELLAHHSRHFAAVYEKIYTAAMISMFYFNYNLDYYPIKYIKRTDVISASTQFVNRPWIHDPSILHLPSPIPSHCTSKMGTVARDWNEDFQITRTFKHEDDPEELLNAKNVYQIYRDFINEAIEGVKKIMTNDLMSINVQPTSSDDAMYIDNNIFYYNGRYYAPEIPESLKGAPDLADKYANVYINSFGIVEEAQLQKNYCTVMEVCIDYLGERVLAQAIIPGIFRYDTEHMDVYGSSDLGKTIKSDPKYAELLKPLTDYLHLKPYKMKDEKEEVHELVVPFELKLLDFHDGRLYLCDLSTVNWRDANYAEAEYAHYVLRRDFVQSYLQHKINLEVEAKVTEEMLKLEEGEPRKEEGEPPSEEDQAKLLEKLKQALEKVQENMPKPMLVNPNRIRYDNSKFVCDDEEAKAEIEILKDCANVLKNQNIPFAANNLSSLTTGVVDGVTLCEYLHKQGINFRYLGLLARHLKQSSAFMYYTVVTEIIARSAKQFFHVFMKKQREIKKNNLHINETIGSYLNLVFGGFKPSKKSAKGKIHHEIVEIAKRRFRFDLTEENVPDNFPILPLLRSVCRKIGVVVEPKFYNFSNNPIFTKNDIKGVFPIIKRQNYDNNHAYNLYHNAQNSISQGNSRDDILWNMFRESGGLVFNLKQTWDPLLANCYNELSNILYKSRSYAKGVCYEINSLVVFEKEKGKDSYEAARSYYTLGCYASLLGETKISVLFLERAIKIFNLIGGPYCPDIAICLSALSEFVKKENRLDLNLDYCLRALEITRFQGNLPKAILQRHHDVAEAYSMLGNYRKALEHEKETYQLCLITFGKDHIRTQESNVWLKQFTAKAVEQETTRRKEIQREVLASAVASTSEYPSFNNERKTGNLFSHSQRQQRVIGRNGTRPTMTGMINPLNRFGVLPNVSPMFRGSQPAKPSATATKIPINQTKSGPASTANTAASNVPSTAP